MTDHDLFERAMARNPGARTFGLLVAVSAVISAAAAALLTFLP
jgi:hypothetical protein